MRYFSVLFGALAATCSGSVWADTLTVETPQSWAVNLPSKIKMGYDYMSLPANEKMGLLGTTYLLEVAPNLHIGPAVYGSITGTRGGLFTIGAEGDWSHPVLANLDFTTGMYVGAGGGGPTSVGGGLMLRPHADLMWNFSGLHTGISYSRVTFPNGTIKGTQLGAVLAADTNFSYTPIDALNQVTHLVGRQGLGFDRVNAVVGRYSARRGAVSPTIGYVGARLERFITPELYWGLETSGAASGNASGYAEFLGTLGGELPVLQDALSVGARVAVGMGGGNPQLINVGGGQLNKYGVYATGHLTRNAHVTLESGYAHSPNGLFRANFSAANLQIDLDHPYAESAAATATLNEWVIGTEHYFSVRHSLGMTDTLNALTFKQNRYLNDQIYLTGQAHFAYGGHSGGYAVGLVGIGGRTEKSASGLYMGSDLLVGAAGGGLVASSGGAVVQPMLYVGMDVAEGIGVKVSAGQVKSLKGVLNSKVLDVALNIGFGTAGR